jgi:asparagine synthase (glutamine-hydrolysing)
MCGIFGLYNFLGNSNINIDILLRNYDYSVMNHRGPDEYGFIKSNEIYLGHNRLSIIDLSGGKQPIFNQSKTKCIIFNGEIFNYKSIQKKLKDKGYIFSTDSDTEVILLAYEEWGERCLEQFRGMFAFCIWDEPNKILFIARDRLGIKPLYYAEKDGCIAFASEMKALLKLYHFDHAIDNDALGAFFYLSYTPGERSAYKSIRKLLPGYYMVVAKGRKTFHKYWDLTFAPDHSKSEQYWIDNFNDKFNESVELRMVSDVPVGAFLSGGVDSGAVVAHMAKVANPVYTFCIGFGGNVGGYLDERPYARLIAKKYATEHTEFEVQPYIEQILDDIVGSFDEPFGDHSTIPSYYLCKCTRDKVKVALSGLGGDELFGGYERYLGLKISKYLNVIPHFFTDKILSHLSSMVAESKDGLDNVNRMKRFIRYASLKPDYRYLGYLSMYDGAGKSPILSDPKMLSNGYDLAAEYILSYFNSDNASDFLDKAFYCDIKTYLPDDILACTDRISMKHSLEVRVPFLDHELMEFCAKIPSNLKIKGIGKKYLLKKAFKGILPEEIMNHKKQGFVGPLSIWMRTNINNYINDTLLSGCKNSDYLNIDSVKCLLKEHNGRKHNHEKLIWSLLFFQKWFEKYGSV